MADASTRTVDRAIALLVAVCDDGALTLAEAARSTGLSASTALRLMRTLESSSLVRRDDGGVFRPGSRMMQLGALALSHESVVSLARPHLEHLVEATGESAYLSVLGHDQTALYLSIVEGTHSIRHTSWVGRTVPLSDSAIGAALEGRVPEAGYVIVSQGVERDVTAIAAPVFGGTGIVAALSIVLPFYRIPVDGADSVGSLIAEQATELSRALGTSITHPIS
jgi:IclR family acetate operon transcriptional repressor